MRFGIRNPPTEMQETEEVADTELPVMEEVVLKKKSKKGQFVPSEDQRNFKARWWLRFNEKGYDCDAEELTMLEIRKVHRHPMLEHWLSDDEFKEYLCNGNEQKDKLECLFGLAVEEIEDILRNRDPRYLAYKMQVIKLIAELADKFPKKSTAPVFSDALIASMTKAQLQEYVAKNKKLVEKAVEE